MSDKEERSGKKGEIGIRMTSQFPWFVTTSTKLRKKHDIMWGWHTRGIYQRNIFPPTVTTHSLLTLRDGPKIKTIHTLLILLKMSSERNQMIRLYLRDTCIVREWVGCYFWDLTIFTRSYILLTLNGIGFKLEIRDRLSF